MHARSVFTVLSLLSILIGSFLLIQVLAPDQGGGVAIQERGEPAAGQELAEIRGKAPQDAAERDGLARQRAGSTARAPEPAPGPGAGSIRVRFLRSGRALARVRVTLRSSDFASLENLVNSSKDTGEDGSLRFERLEAGKYVLGVAGAPLGYRLAVTLQDGEQKDLGDQELGEGAKVRGRLVGEGGNPVGGARVGLGSGDFGGFLDSGEDGLSARSDAGGRFELASVLAGEFVLSVDHRDYRRMDRRVSSPGGKDIDLGELRLSRGRTLEGQVVDGSGKPIPGVVIRPKQVSSVGTTVASGYSRTRSATSDERGWFRLSGLAETVHLRLNADGYENILDHEVPAGETFVKLILRAECSVSGRVRGGVSGEKARVYLKPLRESGEQESMESQLLGVRPLRVETDEQGAFEFRKVRQGRYRIRAEQESFGHSEPREILVGRMGVSELELALLEGARLELRVLGPRSEPVAGARVQVEKRQDPAGKGDLNSEILDGPGRSFETGADGSALVTGLVVGPVTLSVEHPDYLRVARPLQLVRGTNRQTLALESGGWIEGVCYGTDGQPLPDARIVVRPAEAEGESGSVLRRRIRRGGAAALLDARLRSVTSDEHGRFRTHALKPGPWTAALARSDGAMSFGSESVAVRIGGETEDPGSRQTVQVTAGVTSRVVLRKSMTAGVSGLVLSRGRGVEGARVFLWPEGEEFQARHSRADASGRYRFEELLPGRWMLTAKPGHGAVAAEPVELRIPETGGEVNQDLVLGGGVIRGTVKASASGPGFAELQALLRERAEPGAPRARKVAVMIRAVDSGQGPDMSTMTMRPPTA
ncbi:MAG: hypothetical protein ACE5F1_15695, partial [Planctomycetota bacterium]